MNIIPVHRIPLGQGDELRLPDDLQSRGSGDSSGFATALKSAIDEVNTIQQTADTTVENFVEGQEVPVHEVMVRLTEADIAMKLMTAVTTKAIQAYQAISRMQI